jgi:hypothetical protein
MVMGVAISSESLNFKIYSDGKEWSDWKGL